MPSQPSGQSVFLNSAASPAATAATARLYLQSVSLSVNRAKKVAPSLRERRSAELHRQQRIRYAARIYRFGERVQFEVVEHLITTFELDETVVDRILDHFAGIDPAALPLIPGGPR